MISADKDNSSIPADNFEDQDIETDSGFIEILVDNTERPGSFDFYVHAQDYCGATAVAGPFTLLILDEGLINMAPFFDKPPEN